MSTTRALQTGVVSLVVVASAACTGVATTDAIRETAIDSVIGPTPSTPGGSGAAGAAATSVTDEPAGEVILWPTPPTPGLGEPIGTVDPLYTPPALTPVPTPPTEQAFAVRPPDSAPAVNGTWYEYFTDHCGVNSPIDFDGSFWIAVRVSDDPDYETANSRPGRIALIDEDSAMLLMDGGAFVLLMRHDEASWFHKCQ